MPSVALETETAKLKAWLCDKALPFWAETAIDSQGGWYEDLDLDGNPNVNAIRRLRVQARQIYVYALADKMGWYPGKAIVARTFDFMMTHGFEADGEPGFLHLLTADYQIEDAKSDLYDHAFYLLACGWAHHVTLDPIVKQKTEDTANKIEALLDTMSSTRGGWNECIPEALPRRQNPHMHLLEACMAWHDISGDPRWMEKSEEIFNLFECHFFDEKHQIVREYFTSDWQVTAGAIGDTSEPGHLAEWIWLLWMYERRSGTSTSKYTDALYEQLCSKPGPFLNDEEDVLGSSRRGTKRLWVQTEVIKAHLTQANRGVTGAADRAAIAIAAFRDTYLKDNGTWVDQIDENGNPISPTIPTSTFYHIICMIYEAVSCASKPTP